MMNWYSDEKKKEILDRMQGLMKEGYSFSKAAKEAGITSHTANAWQKKSTSKLKRKPKIQVTHFQEDPHTMFATVFYGTPEACARYTRSLT